MIKKGVHARKHIYSTLYIYTMPYENAYNAQVAQQVRHMSQSHVNREKEINDYCNQLRDSFAGGVVRHALS